MEIDKETTINQDLDKYRISVDFLKFEGSTLWQIFNTFFIANAISLGFVSASFVKDQTQTVNYPLFLISGIIGLLVTFLWLITFKINSEWYYFRMDQAKKAEKNICKGYDSWSLLTKDGERFAKKLKLIHFGFSNKNAGYLLITIFIIIYIVSIVWALRNIICKC